MTTDVFDSIALVLGYIVFSCMLGFTAATIFKLIGMWLYRGLTYGRLIVRAEKIHGGVIEDQWRNRPFWEMQLIFKVLFTWEMIRMLLYMQEGDYLANHALYYSISQRYVKNKPDKDKI